MTKGMNWKQILMICLLPALFITLFSFKKTEEKTEKYQSTIWLPVIIPNGGPTKIHKMVTFAGKGYVATNRGLFQTNKNFSEPFSRWKRMNNAIYTQFKNVNDLVVYKENGIEKELIVCYASPAVGRILRSDPSKVQNKVCTNLNGMFNPYTAGKYAGTEDDYFLINREEVRKLSFKSNSCSKVAGMPPVKDYCYTQNNTIIFTGNGIKTVFNSASNKISAGYRSNRGQNLRTSPSSTGITYSIGAIYNIEALPSNPRTVFMASTKGYIYKSTGSGTSWKYYSHGLKPQDDPVSLKSLVVAGNYAYISTQRGIFYTSTTGTQADWKVFSGLPGFRNKKMILTASATHLIASLPSGGIFKKQLK